MELITQYEFFATYIFANRCSSIDKEKKRSQRANNLLSFGGYRDSTQDRECMGTKNLRAC